MQGVAEVDQLDQRTLDRFTAHLLEAGGANGLPGQTSRGKRGVRLMRRAAVHGPRCAGGLGEEADVTVPA
ncbi:MAG: hypothetical protein QOG45_85, partial [Chloroflexota bacterium]|nr:hypothetical protein [Chloroflexota bacterium]